MYSFMVRGNQYIELVKVLYCKLPTISKQTTNFPTGGPEFEPRTSEVGDECVIGYVLKLQSLHGWIIASKEMKGGILTCRNKPSS